VRPPICGMKPRRDAAANGLVHEAYLHLVKRPEADSFVRDLNPNRQGFQQWLIWIPEYQIMEA
jgi:hypothetical protein